MKYYIQEYINHDEVEEQYILIDEEGIDVLCGYYKKEDLIKELRILEEEIKNQENKSLI